MTATWGGDGERILKGPPWPARGNSGDVELIMHEPRIEIRQAIIPPAGFALGRIGARIAPADQARRQQELEHERRRLAWEANDPTCREINRAYLQLERRASLRRGELRRRLDRRSERRQRAAYAAAAVVAVGPLVVAGLR